MKFISSTVRLLAGALAIALAMLWLTTPASASGLEDYQRSVWGPENGAPAELGTMAQTSDGWLWIGTADGLYRFDGVTFERYTPPGKPEFAHMRVLELNADDKGDLYISFFPKDIGVLHKDGRFELLPQPAELRSSGQNAIAVDRDGSLWAIGNGIHHYKDGQWKTVERGPEWTTPLFYSMLVDQDGRLWVSSALGTWNLDRNTERLVKISTHSGGLALSPDGAVWVITLDDGPAVRIAQPAGNKRRPLFANSTVSRLAGQFDAQGTLWTLGCPSTVCLIRDAGTKGAAGQIDRKGIEMVGSANPLYVKNRASLLEDHEGNMWVAQGNQLNRFRIKRFLIPGLNRTGDTYTIASDSEHNTWIAEGDTGALWRMEPGGYPVSQGGEFAARVANGRDGALLIAGKRSIRRVVRGKVEEIPLPLGPGGKEIDMQVLGVLDDGKVLWTATLQTGPIGWNGEKWMTASELKLPQRIYLSQGGGLGQLWLAIVDGDLVLYDSGKKTRYDAKPLGIITGMFPGAILTLGGTNGLAVLTGGKVRLLHSTDPDVLHNISGMVVSTNGDRWFNGAAGVVHISAENWARVLRNPDELLQPEVFGVLDGYPGRASINNRMPSATTADGRYLWFSASGGIVGLDTSNLRRNAVAPLALITNVVTDSGSFSAAHGISLPAGSQNFRAYFTAAALRQPEHVHFQYLLEGVDSRWQDAGTRRMTSYTNVAPGDYVFRVKAINEDGIPSQQPAVLRLTITPTFIQSTAFKLLIVVGIVVVIFFLHRLRVRHLTERLTERLHVKLAERERIARTLHDTILQTVQAMMLRLGTLADALPEGGRTREGLETMLDEARRAIGESRYQVQELRSFDGKTFEELTRICASELQKLYPDMLVEIHSDGESVELLPTVADEVVSIMREALRNAFKHAQAHQIAVNLKHGRRVFMLEVKDDGQGLDPDVARTGYRSGHWGLIGMRERADRIGARFSIASVPGRGTTVTLRLAAALAYPARAA